MPDGASGAPSGLATCAAPRRPSGPTKKKAHRPPKVALTKRPPMLTIWSSVSAADSSRAASYSARAAASRWTAASACSRRPAVSCPTSRPTASITAKVNRYCTSLTANE